MRIIKFHGVGGEHYPAEVFEAQLRYLKKHFSIVSLDSIVQKVIGQSSSTRNSTALTFDDGLRNNYTIAYPILKRLDMPATFFVCAGLIESRRWLWNHEARERLQVLSAQQRAALCRRSEAPSSRVEEIVEWMKILGSKARESVEGAIREMTPDFAPTARQRDLYDMISWEELSSIDPALVTIGAHTVTHPILTSLRPDELSYEIRESRRWLEDRLGRPVEHFCYPNGAGNALVLEVVRACYRSAVTSVPGKVEVGDNVHSLRRISTAMQLPLFAWRMHRVAA